jgi:hypothetical protein
MLAMEALRQVQKHYRNRALIIYAAVGAGLLLAGYRPVGKGLILGAVFSTVNFTLMGLALPYRCGQTRGRTFLVSLGSIWGRLVIMAVPLVMALKMAQFNLYAVVCGLFAIQLTILAEHLLQLVGRRPGKQE